MRHGPDTWLGHQRACHFCDKFWDRLPLAENEIRPIFKRNWEFQKKMVDGVSAMVVSKCYCWWKTSIGSSSHYFRGFYKSQGVAGFLPSTVVSSLYGKLRTFHLSRSLKSRRTWLKTRSWLLTGSLSLENKNLSRVICISVFLLTDNFDRISFFGCEKNCQNCQNPRGDWHPGTDLAFFFIPKHQMFWRKWQFGKVS